MSSNDQSAKAAQTVAGGGRPLPATRQVVPSQPKNNVSDGTAAPVAHPAITSDLLGKAGKAAGMARRPSSRPASQGLPETTISDRMPKVTKTPSEQPAAAAAKAPAGQAAIVKKTGFWPVLAGGILAAGVGAGAAYWAIPHLPQAWQPVAPSAGPVDIEALKQEIISQLPPAAISDPAMMQAAMSEALDKAQIRFEELAQETARDEVAKAFAALPERDEVAPEDLSMALAGQGQRLDMLEKQLALIAETAAGKADTTAPADMLAGTSAGSASTAMLAPGLVEGLQAEVKSLRDRIDEVANRPLPEAGADPAALAALAGQVGSMEDTLGAIGSQVDAIEGRFTGLVAVAGMSKALGGDAQAREAAAKALEDAGLDELAAMGRDTVGLADLQDSFAAAATAGLSAARASAPRASGIGAVGAFLAEQTQARSIEPREGDDPDAIQSRAGALVASGDIAAALDELAAMPDAAQAAMAGWIDSAKAWVAAQDALEQVTRTESE